MAAVIDTLLICWLNQSPKQIVAIKLHLFIINKTSQHVWAKIATVYYIFQLVRALWLVNLAGRILLYGPLKFHVVFVAKLFRDLSPSVLNFYSK